MKKLFSFVFAVVAALAVCVFATGCEGFEMPEFKMPEFELPEFELPNIELPF